MQRFSSVLVANRGEIACRILRTARAMDYHTVAVYTDVDAQAPHVHAADEAVRIGAGPVAESYLSIDRIIAAARASGAGAIHPGYGFLSENAAFARACRDAGFVFIGPSPDAIEIMGNKADAKRRMLEAGVPCVPGYHGGAQDDATLEAEAASIGLPLMVKAAAGGGGRGMRLVRGTGELKVAIRQARSEALQAFGSGELILEKAVLRPRHVEVQIFADENGHTINLGERDCSVQRRHQKVIEEAPCPVSSNELREKMGAAAVAAANSIGYCGAGTVEFLLDQDGAFYFLEMNTRLQVEHPVTEMVTGLDLVALQLRVAQGEPLALTQRDIEIRGHAIEARLYAEDPSHDFLPTSGTVARWEPPCGNGIRVDSGIVSGQEISPFYDPMIAKIIAHGPDREVARRRLLGALNKTVLFGIANNRRFLATCLEKDVFASGAATTAFIDEEISGTELAEPAPGFEDAAVAAVLDVEYEHARAMARSVMVAPQLKNWASAATLVFHRCYRFDETAFGLDIRPVGGAGPYACYRVSDGESDVEIAILRRDAGVAHVGINGSRSVARFMLTETGLLHLMIEGRSAQFRNDNLEAGERAAVGVGGRVVAPMHGLVTEVTVNAGDAVSKGQKLLAMEAMKMQHEVVSPMDGRVREVFVAAGQQVAVDAELIDIDVRPG